MLVMFSSLRYVVVYLAIIFIFFSILIANWAQVSGHIDQNIAVPYFPGPNQPHWGARYGMVSVVAVSNILYIFTSTLNIYHI